MISEVRKKIARELTLVLAERGRMDETALPTDLWKKPVSGQFVHDKIMHYDKKKSFVLTVKML